MGGLRREADSTAVGGDRKEIGALLAGERVDVHPLDVVSELGRLGARLVLQRAVEEELDEWLGRARYERRPEAAPGKHNGYRPRRLKTGDGEVVVEVPQVRDACAPFTSKLFRRRKRFLASEPLKALVIGAFVRGLSVRDVESLCEEAGLGQVSKSTASRLCRELEERFRAFRERDLSGIRLVCLFLDAIFLPTRPSGAKEGVLCVGDHGSGRAGAARRLPGDARGGGGLALTRPLANPPRPALAAACRRRRRARPRGRDRAALAAGRSSALHGPPLAQRPRQAAGGGA